jgi:hypothetical protein
MFQPHRVIFRQHILIEPTALRSLMSVVLVDARRCHRPQFWYFENICSFTNLCIAASLCPFMWAAPLVVCTVYINFQYFVCARSTPELIINEHYNTWNVCYITCRFLLFVLFQSYISYHHAVLSTGYHSWSVPSCICVYTRGETSSGYIELTFRRGIYFESTLWV